MRKIVRRILLPVLLLLLIPVAGCQVETQERKPLLYVNGQEVSEEELTLLNNDTDQAVRMKVLQQWAQELGLAEPFSYEDMVQSMEKENEQRRETKENGGVVYGMVEYTPLQYYSILMGNLQDQIQDKLLEDASEDEIRAWYEENMQNFREFGAITAHVTATSGSVIMAEYDLELSPVNYRSVSEGNEQLAACVLELPVGQTSEWTDEMGVDWSVTCLSRDEDTYQPFEDVQGAAGEQYSASLFQQELEQRIEESAVEDLRP